MNSELLRMARSGLAKAAGIKESFVPADQLQGGMSAMAAPPGAGGMPPGAPPMGPAPGGMPPMDPSMAAAGPVPMDPMAGGMPPMDPMAAAGGMPPGGMPPGGAGQQITLSIDDLRSVVMEATQAALAATGSMVAAQAAPAAPAPAGAEAPAAPSEAKNESGKTDAGGDATEQRIAAVEGQMSQLMSMLMGTPPADAGLGMGAPAPVAPAGAAMGSPAAPPAPSPGMTVQASAKAGNGSLLHTALATLRSRS